MTLNIFMENYHKILKLLKQHCPTKHPVDVRRVELKGYDGTCKKENNKFIIKINKDLNEKSAIDTLLHEYSHAYCWLDEYDKMSDEEFTKNVHGDHWGIAYAYVYRVFEEKFLNSIDK